MKIKTLHTVEDYEKELEYLDSKINIEKTEDEIVDFLEAISYIEKKLYRSKNKIASHKAYYILNTDWKQLNEERAKEDLPKISNQSMKDAYITLMIDDLQGEYDTLKVKYHYLNELWKYNERKNGVEK